MPMSPTSPMAAESTSFGVAWTAEARAAQEDDHARRSVSLRPAARGRYQAEEDRLSRAARSLSGARRQVRRRPERRRGARLRPGAHAGVVLFGKTNVPLYLGDWQSFNAIYGTTNNPWDVKRAPGGSSGGSAAALAAGLTGLEAGSDIGSSIRNPAHFCGVFGHKPTWGIVPRAGQALPWQTAPVDIDVVGPLARSADDLAVGLAAMAGPDE